MHVCAREPSDPPSVVRGAGMLPMGTDWQAWHCKKSLILIPLSSLLLVAVQSSLSLCISASQIVVLTISNKSEGSRSLLSRSSLRG